VDQKNVPKLFTHIETSPFLYVSCVLARVKEQLKFRLQVSFGFICNLD